MISSNQILEISCDKSQLSDVLQFVFNMHYSRDSKKPNLAYQIIGDTFVVGYYYNKPEDGWNKFIFEKPSFELLTATIKQFFTEKRLNGGYIVKSGDSCWNSLSRSSVKHSFSVLLTIAPFDNFYDK